MMPAELIRGWASQKSITGSLVNNNIPKTELHTKNKVACMTTLASDLIEPIQQVRQKDCENVSGKNERFCLIREYDFWKEVCPVRTNTSTVFVCTI